MKKDKRKYIWYAVGIAVLLLFSLILLSSVIDLGMKLREVHVSLEITFYCLVAAIIFFVIINPIVFILKSPSLCITTTLEPNSNKKYMVYKKVASNIVKQNHLTIDQRKMLTEYKNLPELTIGLQTIFDDVIKTQINKIIIKDAKTVMVSTAICQSARFDMITVFSVNINMIKDIVRVSGFRPSMKNLSKLSVNVFSTALIAEGLENLKIEDILPQSASQALQEIPMIKPVMESVTQGVANSLLTLRIGVVTRKYLFKDGMEITKEDIRREALRESLKLIPMIVADSLAFFPRKIVKIFTKKKKDEETSPTTLITCNE